MVVVVMVPQGANGGGKFDDCETRLSICQVRTFPLADLLSLSNGSIRARLVEVDSPATYWQSDSVTLGGSALTQCCAAVHRTTSTWRGIPHMSWTAAPCEGCGRSSMRTV